MVSFQLLFCMHRYAWLTDTNKTEELLFEREDKLVWLRSVITVCPERWLLVEIELLHPLTLGTWPEEHDPVSRFQPTNFPCSQHPQIP